MPDFSIAAKIDVAKADEDMRVVYGWASVVEDAGETVVDSQGDVIEPSELVKAAHEFVTSVRAGKAMHRGRVVAELVESLVFTKDMQTALNVDLGKVGWWVGMHIGDADVWARVKSGELRAFSIAGNAIRESMDAEEAA